MGCPKSAFCQRSDYRKECVPTTVSTTICEGFQLAFSMQEKAGMPTPPKPFEIKPRVFIFACDIVRAFPKRRLDPPSLKVWSQLIASATSSGADLEEASAGGSRALFLSLMRGGLREMRESHYWLRVLSATNPRDRACSLKKISARAARQARQAQGSQRRPPAIVM